MSNDEPTPPQAPRIIKSVNASPCGCRVTEYSDGAKLIAPCVPCGLNAAAESIHAACQQFAANMSNAAQALAAVATTIRNQQSAAIVNEAARNAAHNLRSVP